MFNLINYIKTLIKARKFRKCCLLGKNFSCSSSSNIFVEDGGSCVIGDNSEINCIISVKSGGKITIGSYTTIRGGVIGALESITIGDYVIISNNVHIYDNNNHPTSPKRRIELSKSGFYSDLWHWKHSQSSPITIADNVWIGENSRICKGVTIGDGAIIAACSVVTKDVPSNSIAAGNPARVVKTLKEDA